MHPFALQKLLPPRNVATSACWAGVTTLEVRFGFDVTMYTGDLPSESSFTFNVDGDILPAFDIDWDGQDLEVEVNHAPPASYLHASFVGLDPGLRQVSGGVMTAAFNFQNISQCV